jgi:hypothetical protein
MRYRFSHDPFASQDTWLRGNVLCDCSREKEEGAECCDYCRESREKDAWQLFADSHEAMNRKANEIVAKRPAA